MKKPIALTLALGAATLTSSTFASDTGQSGFTVTPGIGYYYYDSERASSLGNVDESALLSLAAGYQFNNPWAVELVYLQTDSETASGTDVDLEQIRIDALYHLGRNGNFQPYLAAGAGQGEFEINDNDTDESIINLGGGVKYLFTEKLALRTDLRLINSLDDEHNDAALTLGLNYVFGKPAPIAPPAPTDSDKDGIVDGQDQCANTPVGTSVDAQGCSLDTDKDGVVDSLDQCPATLSSVTVDNKGCMLDGDNDGIADITDKCLDTSADAKVDSEGCYIIIKEERSIKLNVSFSNNSSVVKESEYADIEAVASFMREFPRTEVLIEGHTDDRGSAEYNKSLSEKRAKAVASVLVAKFGVSPSRVSAKGFGESRPVVDNTSKAQRIKNRRVVAVVKAIKEVISK